MTNKITALAGLALSLLITGCTTGQATRTSATVYEPTAADRIEILLEKPDRAYEVVGMVGSKGDTFVADSKIMNAMREEAAGLGAHAIWLREDLGESHDWMGNKMKSGRAVAIRWKNKLPAKLPIQLEK